MNNKKSKTRIIAFTFLLCIITVSIFSNVFILSYVNHEHDYAGVGGGCTTCERLSNAVETNKQLGMILTGTVIVVAKLVFVVMVLRMMSVYVLLTTPVGLKTRMNN